MRKHSREWRLLWRQIALKWIIEKKSAAPEEQEGKSQGKKNQRKNVNQEKDTRAKVMESLAVLPQYVYKGIRSVNYLRKCCLY